MLGAGGDAEVIAAIVEVAANSFAQLLKDLHRAEAFNRPHAMPARTVSA